MGLTLKQWVVGMMLNRVNTSFLLMDTLNIDFHRNATQSGHGLPIRDRAFNMSPHPSATAAQIMTTP